jgi:hypothetical protein
MTGLQNMSSDHVKVRSILRVLAMKISESDEELNAQNIGNALYGLKGMSSQFKEVQYILDVLTSKVNNSVAILTSQNVGNALVYNQFIYVTIMCIHGFKIY